MGTVQPKRGRSQRPWRVWGEKEANEKSPIFCLLGARRTGTRSSCRVAFPLPLGGFLRVRVNPGTPPQRAPRKTLLSSAGLEECHPACHDRQKGQAAAGGDLKVGRANLLPEHPTLWGWGWGWGGGGGQAEGPPCAGCSASAGRMEWGVMCSSFPLLPSTIPGWRWERGLCRWWGVLVPHLPLCGVGHRPERWGGEPQFGVSFLMTCQQQSMPGSTGAGGHQPERDALGAGWGAQVGRGLGRGEEGVSSAGWGGGGGGSWPLAVCTHV